MAAIGRFLRLGLAVAALKGEAERDIPFEVRPDSFEQREDRSRWRGDALRIARRERGEIRGGTTKLAAQGRVSPVADAGRGRGGIGFGAECGEGAAGLTERAPDLIDGGAARAACCSWATAAR